MIMYGIRSESETDAHFVVHNEPLPRSAAQWSLVPSWWTRSLSVSISGHVYRESEFNLLSVKYVPAWFPGAGFQKIAEDGKKDLDESMYSPFEHVKGSMVRYMFSRA